MSIILYVGYIKLILIYNIFYYFYNIKNRFDYIIKFLF
jgi:hypothetical protein